MAICERCGKQHDGSYGSGKFCSRSCANTRMPSKETKEKIQKSVKQSLETGWSKTYNREIVSIPQRQDTYKNNQHQHKNYKSPQDKFCVVCGKQLTKRNRKTCSKECHRKWAAIQSGKQKQHGSGHKGIYKGFRCDSSLELAFLIYNLDHNIPIERCNRTFTYEYKNKKHLYYPDFIVNNIIIEIKGWDTESAKIKMQAVLDQGEQGKILYRQDLDKEINYVCSQYNILEKDICCLYDPDKFEKICPICGKSFVTRNKSQITCSSKCASKYTANNYIWFSDGQKVKRIPPEAQKDYLQNGWYKVKPIPGKKAKDWLKI